MRGRSPIPIEIRHCLLYSVGETEDGSPQIWVSGSAGWFELSPCPAYQATYDTMCQATTLYYSIMDIVEDMKTELKRGKKSKSPSQSDVLASIFHKVSFTFLVAHLASNVFLCSIPPLWGMVQRMKTL